MQTDDTTPISLIEILETRRERFSAEAQDAKMDIARLEAALAGLTKEIQDCQTALDALAAARITQPVAKLEEVVAEIAPAIRLETDSFDPCGKPLSNKEFVERLNALLAQGVNRVDSIARSFTEITQRSAFIKRLARLRKSGYINVTNGNVSLTPD